MTTTADWDEIKRLAADFQKAQLSSTVQRLSERNCIELVTKLIELKLIDVIFTTDGKEYLTHQELIKEIKDELFVRGGRVNTVDLARELMVDLSQINASVIEIIRSKDVMLVTGYLISSSYLEKIAREINEKVLQLGQINVGDLTLQYDLPADLLLHNVLERNLGKIIQARQDPADPRTFYTEDFITRAKAKMRGAVMGLLRPTPVTVIINQCNVSERLFHLLFDQINAPGALTGRQSGAQYVPHCYTKSQINWVTNFFKQNDYLEYDALSRLGISDPKTFIKRNVNNENLLFLDSCAVGSRIKDQIDTALEECIATKSFIDVVSLLPSVLNSTDIQSMLELLLKNNQKSTVLFEDTVVSTCYLDKLTESCMPMVKAKAERVVEDGSYQKFYIEKQLQSKSSHETQPSHFVDLKAERRDERRRKATSGKAGGGTQGREVKTKSIKKHQRGGKHNVQDSDDEEQNTALNKKPSGNLQIVNVVDVEGQLLGTLEEEGIEDLNTAIATHILRDLNQAALTIAQSLCDKKLQNASQSRKQTHSSAQDKINILTNDIRLYEKGIKMFNTEQQPQFVKYLLKTFGGDIATEFCIYAANQCNLQVPSENLTVEQRNKIINDVTDEYKKPLQALTASLFDPNTEVFFQALESCLSTCGMILKKVDKKKDRIILHNHKEKLLEELSNTEDPALALHLAVLVIFTNATQTMLHASGRQVPTILTFLKSHLADEDRNRLSKYHDLVTKYLISNDDKKTEVEEDLKSEINKIKLLATEYKKVDKRDVSGE